VAAAGDPPQLTRPESRPPTRADLAPRHLARVWAPLAATFLLVTGSTPVVNASINRLPGRIHEAELAAFALLLACTIVIHSPLFVTREIAIKLSIDRAGSRRALYFGLAAATVVSAFEVVMALTPVGSWILGRFTQRPELVAMAQPAFLVVAPVPFFIAIRAVYQAHQIRADDTLWVGLGTATRLGLTAVIGLALAPRVGLDGPMLGAFCVLGGIITETVFAFLRARHSSRPPHSSTEYRVDPIRFGLPLMFANFLGVAVSLGYLRIAGMVPLEIQDFSIAGFQEVKSLHWLLGAGGFALQSLTTAKVRRRGDEHAMLRFAFLVSVGLTAAFAVVVFTPVRDWILIDALKEKAGGEVMKIAIPALAVAILMPAFNAIRFTLRGTLIARGRSRAITMVNLVSLSLVFGAISFSILPFPDNGALNAYVMWNTTTIVEIAILWRVLREPRGGLPRGSGRGEALGSPG